jgi:hypothetical protein
MAYEQRGSMLAWSLAPEAVGMITAYTAMLTPCWQPKILRALTDRIHDRPGHSHPAFGERPYMPDDRHSANVLAQRVLIKGAWIY